MKYRKFCPGCGCRCYGQYSTQRGVTVRHLICGTCPWQRVLYHNGPKGFRAKRKPLSTVAKIITEV